MLKDNLRSISPLDGRYSKKLQILEDRFSEFALIKYRLQVEVEWLIFLSSKKDLNFIKPLSKKSIVDLKLVYEKFSLKDAKDVKKIESVTNHDVKAVELFLIKKLNSLKLSNYKEFVHLFCTSEDINNLAYNLMVKDYLSIEFKQITTDLKKDLKSLAKKWAKLSMLSHTHGQSASPTTLGKEFANFYARLEYHLDLLNSTKPSGKINGAVGNYNAHQLISKKLNWPDLSKRFVKSLGLEWTKYSTQIEPKDVFSSIISHLENLNNVLIDLSQDNWIYISKGYLKQRTKKNEVGSSTMPHKVNPIDFENAEGNFKLANSFLVSIKEKIQISRLQRDLSDSTTLRNLGSAFSYSYLAINSLRSGLSKVEPNKEIISNDLNNSWEVLTEAVQTILRKNKVENSYEKIKKLTRGKSIDKNSYLAMIAALDIKEEDKVKLTKLTPFDYVGLAEKLAKEI